MFQSYATHESSVLSSSADMKNYTQDIEVGVLVKPQVSKYPSRLC